MVDVLIDAENAERLLNDATFTRMVEKLEVTIVNDWKQSRDPAMRERCHAKLELLRGLLAEFSKTIDAGAFEKARRKLHA